MSRPPPKNARSLARRRIARGAPGPSVTLSAAEVRALLRLANELHESPPDPETRKKRLLEGLCRILRADGGVCVTTHPAASDGASTVVTMSRWGTGEHEDAYAVAANMEPAARKGSPIPPPGANNNAAAARHCIDATTAVAGGRMRACVALFRRRPARAPFSPREKSVLGLFHAESAWLYRLDLPLVSPAGLALTPRQRQTLQLLLAGQGEKQIAARLSLSPNTVHHYIKAIHRHFRVSSRSELLARWVGR